MYAFALFVEMCFTIAFVLIIQKYNVDFAIVVIAALFLSITYLITISMLCNPTKYVFAHDGTKFGFRQNDDLIVEGYFLDIDDVNLQKGVSAYQSEIASKTSDGDYVAPYIVSSMDDLVIKLKGQKPVCLPSGFSRIFKEFIDVYKKSV